MNKYILTGDMPKSCSECNSHDNHFTDDTILCEKTNERYERD